MKTQDNRHLLSQPDLPRVSQPPVPAAIINTSQRPNNQTYPTIRFINFFKFIFTRIKNNMVNFELKELWFEFRKKTQQTIRVDLGEDWKPYDQKRNT